RLSFLEQRGRCRLDLPDIDATHDTGAAAQPGRQHYAEGGVPVDIGRASVVELPPRIFRGRLVAMLFDTAKASLFPSAMTGIAELVSFYRQFQDLKVLVTGHTDTVGPASYNAFLSLDRARAISAFLRNRVADWMKFYAGTGASDPWGVRED